MTHDHNHDHEHEERELITLVDEQGNETLFEILLTIDGKEEFGKNYVLLIPANAEEDENGEVEIQAYSFTENEDGTEGESHRPGSGHPQEDQTDQQPQPDRPQDEHRGAGAAGTRLDQDVGQETGAPRAPLRRVGGAGHPDQEQPHPAQEPGDGAHQ